MADGTHIEWTDATWNIITGCSVVSAGCKHCYAMKLAGTRLAHHPSREGLTIDTAAGPVWNGEVRFNTDWLHQPLQWTRPRRIFVCAHGDLFHESVPDDWIERVFAVMAQATHHTFQVLTKRPARMREWFNKPRTYNSSACGSTVEGVVRHTAGHPRGFQWPLPNVWLGVSVEDQAAADARIPDLLSTPAAVRWISAEPLLGPVNLTRVTVAGKGWHDTLAGWRDCDDYPGREHTIDWVVVGGESGPGARPMNPQWVRDLRDQCMLHADVPFLFKQWGSWVSVSEVEGAGPHHAFPDGRTVRNVGKRRAGRLLDGIEYNGFPEVRA